MTRVHSHYENLKVARNAPVEVIRAAYRVLAQKHHPDVNSSDNAERVMAILNEAWRVLGDPKLRREHDQWIIDKEKDKQFDNSVDETKSATRAESDQQTKSRQQPESHSRQPSSPFVRLSRWLETPSGIKLGSLAIVAVVISGWFVLTRPPEKAKASLAARSSTEQLTDVTEQFAPTPLALERLGATGTIPSLKRNKSGHEWGAVSDAPASQSTRWSPNGMAFPAFAGYLQGMPRRATGGLSKLTIDNRGGGADVYLKLCSANTEHGNCFRHVFIPQGSSFLLLGIAPGNYSIRYRNLKSGQTSRSETIAIREQDTGEGSAMRG